MGQGQWCEHKLRRDPLANALGEWQGEELQMHQCKRNIGRSLRRQTGQVEVSGVQPMGMPTSQVVQGTGGPGFGRVPRSEPKDWNQQGPRGVTPMARARSQKRDGIRGISNPRRTSREQEMTGSKLSAFSF